MFPYRSDSSHLKGFSTSFYQTHPVPILLPFCASPRAILALPSAQPSLGRTKRRARKKKKDSLIRSDSVELLSLDRVHLDELYHPLLGTYTHPSSSPIGFVTDVHSRSRAAHYAYKPPEQHIRQALCVRCSTSRNLYGSILARTETALRMCFYINARSRDTTVYSRLHGRVSIVAFTWMRTEMATMPFGESSASL